MGYFDVIRDEVLRCPYCGGRGSELKVQTKAFTNQLKEYEIEYFVPTDKTRPDKDKRFPRLLKNVHWIDAWASCRSALCCAYAAMRSMSRDQGSHVSDRIFSLRYQVVDGVPIAPAIIMENPSERTHIRDIRDKFKDWLESHPKVKRRFHRALDLCGGEFGLAVLGLRYSSHWRRYGRFKSGRPKGRCIGRFAGPGKPICVHMWYEYCYVTKNGCWARASSEQRKCHYFKAKKGGGR